MDATIREAPVFAPASAIQPEPRADKAPGRRSRAAIAVAPDARCARSTGPDFLIEPGSGAPLPRRLEKRCDRRRQPEERGQRSYRGGATRGAGGARRDGEQCGAQGRKASAGTRIQRTATPAAASNRRRRFSPPAVARFSCGVALVALLTIAFVELGVMRQPSRAKVRDRIGRRAQAGERGCSERGKHADQDRGSRSRQHARRLHKRGAGQRPDDEVPDAGPG